MAAKTKEFLTGSPMKYDTGDKGSTSTKKTPDVDATPDSVDSPKGDLGDRHDAFPLGIPERIYTRIRRECLAILREEREPGVGPTAKAKANECLVKLKGHSGVF